MYGGLNFIIWFRHIYEQTDAYMHVHTHKYRWNAQFLLLTLLKTLGLWTWILKSPNNEFLDFIFFVKYNSYFYHWSSLFFCRLSCLLQHSSWILAGLLTGLVIDSGDGVTHVVNYRRFNLTSFFFFGFLKLIPAVFCNIVIFLMVLVTSLDLDWK